MTLKIEAGKRYRTRGGDEVEVLKTGLNTNGYTVFGVHTTANGVERGRTWLGGSYYFEERDPSHLDLISEIRPKRVVWLNVYEGDQGAMFFSSRQEADADYLKCLDLTPARLACIRVEFEEGQFDD